MRIRKKHDKQAASSKAGNVIKNDGEMESMQLTRIIRYDMMQLSLHLNCCTSSNQYLSIVLSIQRRYFTGRVSCVVFLNSWGCGERSNSGHIRVNEKLIFYSNPKKNHGFVLAVLVSGSCRVREHIAFDVDATGLWNMTSYLERLPEGTVILGITACDASG